MDKLIEELVDAGVLQFGIFGEGKKPFEAHLDLLPSYPQVLKTVVTTVLPFTEGFDRLVCLPDSMPFGVALAMTSGIPLVYSRGAGQAAVYDLVGAYDIGHPALLLLHDLSNGQAVTAFIQKARQVGLNIQSVLVILKTTQGELAVDVKVNSLLRLNEIVDHLVKSCHLPDGHAIIVAEWINHHPG